MTHPVFQNKRFRIGERVNAKSIKNKSILGEFRGYRNSFGVYVYGIEVGSCDPPSLHTCLKLTLERVKLEHPPRPRGRPKGPTLPKKLVAGDPCIAITKDNRRVSGFYMNSEGTYAWIKGWLDNTSKFEAKQAFKVFKESIRKV